MDQGKLLSFGYIRLIETKYKLTDTVPADIYRLINGYYQRKYECKLMQNSVRSYHHKFKMIMIGQPNVGKTEIMNRFINPNTKNNKTSEMQIASILFEEQVIRLILWDMPSSNSQHTKIKGIDGVFIVFDLTNADSFEFVAEYLESKRIQNDNRMNEGIERILLGNKSDLSKKRKVSRRAALSLANQRIIEYVEVSARNASNLQHAFLVLIKNMMKRKEKINASTHSKQNSNTTECFVL